MDPASASASSTRRSLGRGIAQRFLWRKIYRWLCCALVLGDNIFYGHDLAKTVSAGVA